MRQSFKNSLSILALTGLVACSAPLTQQTVDDINQRATIESNARLHGTGFSIAAPAGANWKTSAVRPNAIVFQKNLSGTDAASDNGFYMLTAGVTSFKNDALLNKTPKDFETAARTWLAERFRVWDREILLLETGPAQLHGASCVEYRLVQVDRFFPERLDPRYEFVQHGYVCQHPDLPALLIQPFFTEQFLRTAPPSLRIDPSEASAFFRQLQFTNNSSQ
ncbi:MAG: hypothetical protein ACXU7Z_07385 [Burkholderiaceae bacterium]